MALKNIFWWVGCKLLSLLKLSYLFPLFCCFQVEKSSNFSDEASSVGDTLDDDALTMIQSACRGHLARCSLAQER